MRSSEPIAIEALSLPVDERAALVLRLAESLDEEHDTDAEDAWAAEVAARIDASARSPRTRIPSTSCVLDGESRGG